MPQWSSSAQPEMRANAAIYYVPEGFSTSGGQLMGLQAASEGFLRALAVHGRLGKLYAFGESQSAGEDFDVAVRGFNARLTTEWIESNQAERLAPIGTLMLPGPGLSAYAWMRRRVGAGAFSLCGITHTTATPSVLDALADLWTAPIEPWDAVICPSVSVRSMVTKVLEDQRSYLEERFGPISLSRPQLPVIPLGVDSDAYAPDLEARTVWRAKLAIPDDEVVLLYFGRLNPFGKSHPVPLFLALAAAAMRSSAPLHLVLAGWFSQPGLEDAYQQAAELICPDVRITIVDGRLANVRKDIWQAADIFISPVDNIQETFGLTPLEAMAAGLPVIASDWDGYRETIRHGVDGLLAPTYAPPAGSSPDLATNYSSRTIGYEQYAGFSSQAVAVDVGAMAEAIVALADGADLRRTMGESGRRRAQEIFDWRHIIQRYQDLWRGLSERRKSADSTKTPERPHPSRPDPFYAFASYPTNALSPDTTLSAGMVSAMMVPVLLDSPLIAFACASLPTADQFSLILRRLHGGATQISQIFDVLPDVDQGKLWRGVAWLLKYGVVRIGA